MRYRLSARELIAFSVLAMLLAVGTVLTALGSYRQEIRIVPTSSSVVGSLPAVSVDDNGPYVNVNTASAEQLVVLPGIGPAKARAIIEHRKRVGQFSTVDALIEVRGIGPKLLERLRPHVTVGVGRRP